MLFVCYPKCTTCQKAKKWLDEKGISYTLRDIKTENPTQEELRTWWQESGLPLKRFFNTSGQLYKAMDLKNKLPAMSEEEQLALLATDGMLVKRPILVGESSLSKWGSGKKSGKKSDKLEAYAKGEHGPCKMFGPCSLHFQEIFWRGSGKIHLRNRKLKTNQI